MHLPAFLEVIVLTGRVSSTVVYFRVCVCNACFSVLPNILRGLDETDTILVWHFPVFMPAVCYRNYSFQRPTFFNLHPLLMSQIWCASLVKPFAGWTIMHKRQCNCCLHFRLFVFYWCPTLVWNVCFMFHVDIAHSTAGKRSVYISGCVLGRKICHIGAVNR